MPILATAILLNSALYLSGCFVAGLVTGNGIAWRLALAAAGVTYLGYLAQVAPVWPMRLINLLVIASILLGAAAGAALLV